MTAASGIGGRDVLQDPRSCSRGGAVGLVHETIVRHAQVRLAGVVGELVAGAQRVDDHDREVGPQEREVVVAAVPDQDVGLARGQAGDLGVVDAGVDEHAHLDRALVLLALLDRRVGGVDVGDRREALHAHRLEVAIGHRVADQADP